MTNEPCNVRPMAAEDVGAAVEIWQEMSRQHAAYDGECWDFTGDAAEHVRRHFAESLAEPKMVQLVAEDGTGRIVGFARGSVRASLPVFGTAFSADIWDVAVAPGCRRRGVATALVEEMCRRFREMGADDVQLKVAVRNAAAVGLYEKLGLRGVMTVMYKRL